MRLRSPRNGWLAAITIGSVAGSIALGAGSRLAMRGIAISAGQPGVWTVKGTFTVIMLGTLVGAAAALGRAALSSWHPRRLTDAARASLFAVRCLLLTLRGLNPITSLRLALFLPVVVAYIVVTELAWRGWQRTRSSHAPGETSSVANYTRA